MATILYGNGLNRLDVNAPSWDNMLKQIEPLFNPPSNSQMQIPATIQYDRIELLASRTSIELIEDLCGKIKGPWKNPIYERMSNLTDVNFLTTNYDYTLESYYPQIFKSEKRETVYNVFSYKTRYDKLRDNENIFDKCNVWHIHGDIERPKSIILGYNHYCKEIAEIRKYIPYSIRNLIHGGKVDSIDTLTFPNKSWIDLFFKDDIFIIGLDLNFSELDLWWLIDMWSRLKKMKYVTNTIYYLDAIQKNKKNESRQSFIDTLKCFKIEYVSYEASTYEEAYRRCMDFIENSIKLNTKPKSLQKTKVFPISEAKPDLQDRQFAIKIEPI